MFEGLPIQDENNDERAYAVMCTMNAQKKKSQQNVYYIMYVMLVNCIIVWIVWNQMRGGRVRRMRFISIELCNIIMKFTGVAIF